MNRHLKDISRRRHGTGAVWSLIVVLLCTLALPASAATASFSAISKSLDTSKESCPNNSIDPGETNTVTFVFKNTADAALTDVKIEMLGGDGVLANATPQTPLAGNVAFAITGEQTIGNVAKDAQFNATFTFRAAGSAAGTISPRFRIIGKRDGADFDAVTTLTDQGKFDFQLGSTVATTYTFANTAKITVKDNAVNEPALSTVTPSNVPNSSEAAGEKVKRVEVVLHGVDHPFARDLNVMLIGPGDQKVILMREAGGNTSATGDIPAGTDITFSQSASAQLPVNAAITSTSYKPSDFGTGNFNEALGASTATDLNVAFANRNANTQWKLYVTDDSPSDVGEITGGWTLRLITEKVVACGQGETFPTITQGTATDTIKPGISNVTINEDVKDTVVAFSVADLESSSIEVTATSSNQALVTDSNLIIEGATSGENKSIKIKELVANAFGTSTITVNVKDASNRTTSTTFTLTVNSVNDQPTFKTEVENQSLNIGSRTPTLTFTIDDVEDDEANLIVTASSGTQSVVPDANIILSGQGANRTVIVIPAQEGTSGTAGSSTIVLTVRDSNGSTKSSDFVVAFEAQRNQPTISPIDDQSTAEDTTKRVPFTVRPAVSPSNNAQTTADGLTVTRTVSSTPANLFSSVTFAGSGSQREIVFVPEAHLTGTAEVTITVSDGVQSRSSTFDIAVTAVNDRPTIAGLPEQVTIAEDGATAVLPFTIGDVETTDLADFIAGAANGKRITVEVLPAGSPLVPQTIVNNDTDAGIRFGVSGTNPSERTIRIKPAANQNGKATIRLTINDAFGGDNSTASASFVLNVDPVNDAPVIAQVKAPSQAAVDLPGNATDAPELITVTEDQFGFTDNNPNQSEIEVLGVTAGSTAEGAREFEQNVTLSVSHDNNALIQEMFLDPSSVKDPTTTTKIKYRLKRNAFGVATITLTATDDGTGGSNQTVRKFKLRVSADNDTPTFSGPAAGGTIANQQVGEGQAVVVPITLSDVETSAADMLVAVKTSSNAAVVDPNNIVLDAAKSKVTIIANSSNAIGIGDSTTITLQFRDRGAENNSTDPNAGGLTTASRSFTVTIADIPVNSAPTMTLSRDNQTIQEDQGVATADITLTDAENVTEVTLTATSSNPALVPSGNVLFGLSGATRSLAVVPAADMSGTATITITATDGGVTIPNVGSGQNKLSVSKTFVVTVTEVEDGPRISLKQSGPFFTNEDEEVKDTRTDSDFIEIEVSDAETATENLTISKASSKESVIPPANIIVEGTGRTRQVKIVPASNRNTLTASTGVNDPATITLKVKDSANQEATLTFNVSVRAKNDSPAFTKPSDMSISEDAGVQSVTITGIVAGGSEAGPINGNAMNLTLSAAAKVVGKDDNSSLISTPITINPSTITVTDGSATYSATLTFKADDNEFGDAEIAVTVTDNSNGAAISETGGSNGTAGGVTSAVDAKSVTQRFKVSVASVNDRPTINAIQDVTTLQDTPVGPTAITIADTETTASELEIALQSSNPNVVPNNTTNPDQPGMTLTGSGANRGVIIKPASGASGESTITVTVTDKETGGAAALSTNKTFKVTVSAGQDPTISQIANQTANVNTFTDVITFTVNDGQTGAANLTVRAASSNTSVVPVGNIQFGPVSSGSPTTRSMIIKTGEQPGSSDITITVRDGDGRESSRTFTMVVRGQVPTISAIADQQIQKNQGTGAIAFTIADAETFPGFLTLSKSSSNPTFIPEGNIVFGGSNGSRTVTITPAADKEGSSTITITVTDNEGQTASRSFVVSTPDNNVAPTITSITNQSTSKDTPTGLITFTVGDTETAVGNLTVAATSSNTTLVPNGNILLGGQGSANRTLLITPVSGQEGSTTITVTVTDGGGKTAQTSFTLTVRSSTAPTISSVSNQTIDKNTSANVTVTVGDAETAAGQLVITATSSDQTLVPSSNVTVSGTGANRNVTITPANNQVGAATITLTVADSDNKTASTSFTVTVNQTGAAKGDLNGDGKADILFQDDGGFLAVWTTDSDTVTGANYLTPSNIGDLTYRIAGSGDFNRDGKEDLLFESSTGGLAVWYMDGGTQVNAGVLNPAGTGDTNWKVVGVGDFNRDGKADIAYQHVDGTLAVWFMDGVDLVSASLIEPANPGDAAWKVVGVGDLNGDNRQDLVFQHNDGTLACWNLNGANGVTVSTAALLNPSFAGDNAWRVVGICDRNGDKKADLLFQHTDGSVAIWYMDGANVSSAKMLNPSTPGGSWKVVAPR